MKYRMIHYDNITKVDRKEGNASQTVYPQELRAGFQIPASIPVKIGTSLRITLEFDTSDDPA